MIPPRIFTLREAEATLPLVRRIVTDLLRAHPRWQELVGQYELLTAPLTANDEEPPALIAVREAVAREAEVINGYLQELEALGVHFKGFELGLVDFYALRDDHLVFLCWKPDEEHITHWHEVDAGFAGRQPVDQGMFITTVS